MSFFAAAWVFVMELIAPSRVTGARRFLLYLIVLALYVPAAIAFGLARLAALGWRALVAWIEGKGKTPQ